MAEKDLKKSQNLIENIINKLAEKSEESKVFSDKYFSWKKEVISSDDDKNLNDAMNALFEELNKDGISDKKREDITKNINENLETLLPEIIREEFNILLKNEYPEDEVDIINILSDEFSAKKDEKEDLELWKIAKSKMYYILKKTSDNTKKREEFSDKFSNFAKDPDFQKNLNDIRDNNIEIQQNLKDLNLKYKDAIENDKDDDLEAIEVEIEENLKKFEENIDNIIPEELKSDFESLLANHSKENKLEIAGLLLRIWAERDDVDGGELELDEEYLDTLFAETILDEVTEDPDVAEADLDAPIDEDNPQEDEEEEENKEGYHSIKTIHRKSHYEFSSIGSGGNEYLDVVNRLVIDPVLDFGLNGIYQGWDGILNATENFKDWRRQKDVFKEYAKWMNEKGLMGDVENDPDLKSEYDNIINAKSLLSQNRALNKSSKLLDKKNNPFADMDALKDYWNKRKAMFKERIEDEAKLDPVDVKAKNEDGEEEHNYAIWGTYQTSKEAGTNKTRVFEEGMRNIPEGMWPGMPIPNGWDETTGIDPATLDRMIDHDKPFTWNRKTLYKTDNDGKKIYVDDDGNEISEEDAVVAKHGKTKAYDEDIIEEIEKDFRKEAVDFFKIFEGVDLMDLKTDGNKKELEKVKSTVMGVVDCGKDTFEHTKNIKKRKEKNLYDKISSNILNAMDSYDSRG